MKADSLEIAAWSLVLGEQDREELPDLAVAAFERGHDSDALLELAGQYPMDRESNRDLFLTALGELGIELPLPEQARWNLVRELARSTVCGEISPIDGMHELAGRAEGSYSDEDLGVFCVLSLELEDDPPARAKVETEVVDEARALLDRLHTRTCAGEAEDQDPR